MRPPSLGSGVNGWRTPADVVQSLRDLSAATQLQEDPTFLAAARWAAANPAPRSAWLSGLSYPYPPAVSLLLWEVHRSWPNGEAIAARIRDHVGYIPATTRQTTPAPF